MSFRWVRYLSGLALALVVSGCVSPKYSDTKNGPTTGATPFGEVAYHVYDSYTAEPPNCVAILPFSHAAPVGLNVAALSPEQVELVRKAFYAHLAPHGKKDVELARVDFVLESLSEAERGDMALLGRKLGCDAVISGKVTEMGSAFLGVYSKVAVGAELTMIRADTGQPLWEGAHVAKSHGGSIPLSPIGIAAGIFDAAMNLEEEQIFRVTDDLARRLVSTIPDNRIAIVEEPMSAAHAVAQANAAAPTLKAYLARLATRGEEEKRGAFVQAIETDMFHGDDLQRLHEAFIEEFPNDAGANGLYAEYLVKRGDYFQAAGFADKSLRSGNADPAMYFLKGRIQIKLNDLAGADASILRAVALDRSQARYFNGLGFLNSLRGNHERALAAYQMALDLEPTNGYALYNMGVTFHNLADLPAAREYMYQAAQAYIASKDYGPAVKALADLKGLSSAQGRNSEEVAVLENALVAVQRN